MANPLLLPDIIHLLGAFISPWKLYQEPGENTVLAFHPQDLARCIQVCRLWRDTLTPFLWAVYHEDVLQRPVYGATSVHKKIPKKAMEIHSQYLRYLNLEAPWPALTENLNRLRQLSVSSYAFESCKHLLFNNRLHLTDMTLTGFSDTDFDSNDFLPPINLPRLTHLTIDRFEVRGRQKMDQISRFLNANTQLVQLSVLWVQCWPSITEWHNFPHLRHLVMDSELDMCPAVVDLVRHSPALDTLTLAPFKGNVSPALVKNLQECCPALTAIRCTDALEVLHSNDCISDEDWVSLMQASTRLLHIELAVYRFRLDLGEQLVRLHGQWLETVSLTVDSGTELSFASVGKILHNCPKLVSFSLRHVGPTLSSEANERLFSLPWKCLRLENIKLETCACHVETPVSPAVVVKKGVVALVSDSETDLEFMTRISEHGWRIDRAPEDRVEGNFYIKQVRRLRNKVFERVIDLPRMHSVSIEGYEYFRRT
ncbi:MAG: hypothetical protein BYD32DRAFT_427648 [Podila humilis]|nr:MAG: hypothetical protein BYD32DRAFT_427648 [Podila humilis]